MGIDSIIAEINKTTESQINQLLTVAKNQQSEIIRIAEEEVRKIKDKSITDTGQKINANREHEMTVFKLEVQKELLHEKRRCLEKVYTEVEKHILQLPVPKYRTWYTGLVLPYLTGNEQIVVGNSDRDKLNTDWIAQLNQSLVKQNKPVVSLSTTPAVFNYGCKVLRGKSEFNFTLPNVLANIREKTEPEVIKILFS